MKEVKNLMHVGLEEPNEKRRDILNSAIKAVKILKSYEKFKKLKKEKDLHGRELKLITKEIKVIFKDLEGLMPHVEIEKEEPKKEKKIITKPHKENPAVKQTEIKKDTHIAKLERDMEALRDKMSKL